MRLASLFAGIGGFDLAAERAGMEVVWQSEIDRHASRVLDHHWPAVKNLGDIHGITDAPGVDVLTGGFPCQDYSVAGNRGGLAGDRGALWWEYHRLITELRPTWVVGENVPGLLSSRDGADFETIVGSLTECGYGVAWAVLDAQYFGVAQRRRRVFIVGHSGGEPRPEVLALGEGVFGHPEARRETGKAVAALTHNGLGGGGPDDNLAQAGHLTIGFSHGSSDVAVGGDVAPSMTARHGDQGGVLTPLLAATLTQGAPSAGRRNEDDVNLVAFAQNQRDEIRELGDLAGGLQSEPGTHQSTFLVQGAGRTSKGSNGDGWAEEITYTLNTTDQHGIVNASAVRRLTPLECERLQGFPDGWTDIPGNSDTQRYRQLGNAVAVPVVEWLMNRIVRSV